MCIFVNVSVYLFMLMWVLCSRLAEGAGAICLIFYLISFVFLTKSFFLCCFCPYFMLRTPFFGYVQLKQLMNINCTKKTNVFSRQEHYLQHTVFVLLFLIIQISLNPWT